MATTAQPADTRMMGIVHGALVRDLLRTREVVSTSPYPCGRQRQALGEHVVWMLELLHKHHRGEDEGLWPLVRDRDPGAAALLDSMEADHERISPAAEAATGAARRYAASATEEARIELAGALDALIEVLLPHLDREVAEAMPVVSACLSHAEWRAWETTYNVRTKSITELGMEAHWLLEGIDPEGYRVVVTTVPPVPRFILLHGFARAYRRRSRQRWQPDRSARPTPARS